MIVARIRTMKNRTDDTTMREEVNEDPVSMDSICIIYSITCSLAAHPIEYATTTIFKGVNTNRSEAYFSF